MSQTDFTLIAVDENEAQLLNFIAWALTTKNNVLAIDHEPVHFSDEDMRSFKAFAERVYNETHKEIFEEMEREEEDLSWMLEAYPDGYVSDGVRIRRGADGRVEFYSE